jgi:hypothetical protein
VGKRLVRVVRVAATKIRRRSGCGARSSRDIGSQNFLDCFCLAKKVDKRGGRFYFAVVATRGLLGSARAGEAAFKQACRKNVPFGVTEDFTKISSREWVHGGRRGLLWALGSVGWTDDSASYFEYSKYEKPKRRMKTPVECFGAHREVTRV